MGTLNPFLTSDAFSLTELTAAMIAQAYVPQQVADLGIFENGGISTTSAMIESDGDSVALVDIAPRGGPGKVVNADKRTMRPFIVPHLPERATIMADEVQGVRAFGSQNAAQAITAVRDARLAKMRRQIDYTIEAHRLKAIQGSYYDVNGTLTSLFTTFGVSQQTTTMALTTSTTKVRQKVLEVQGQIESALDGLAFSGVTVLCGANFWSELVEHPALKESLLSWQGAQALRADPRLPLSFGEFNWIRYRGTSAATIPTDEAYAIPTGVAGLFLTRYAPADYMETVNTVGLPYYAKSEPLPMNKGLAIEAQSNPLNICTRPRAVIKLAKA